MRDELSVPDNRVERSYDTLVACPHCGGVVDASLEVERGIADVLTRLALSPAWEGVNAPRLEGTLTRLVQDYDERIQERVTRGPLRETPIPTADASKPRMARRRRQSR